MSAITVSDESVATNLQRIDEALAWDADGGAEQAEVVASDSVGLTISARMRDIETIESQHDRGFAITVYRNHCKGSASTSDLSADAVRRAVDKALYIASQTNADECAGLADAERMASEFPDLSLEHPWSLSLERAKQLAIEIEAAALGYDAQISNSEGASVASANSASVYGNSHGFRGAQRRTSHSLSCSVIAGEGSAMQRDYYYSSARNPQRLLDATRVGECAAQRTLERLSPRKLDTGEVAVVFRHDVARGLVGHLLSAISGSAQYRKSSFLLDAVGSAVLPQRLSLYEQPFLPEGPASTSFDNEGVATCERAIVADGVLQGLVLSSYSARRLGQQTTGNAGGVHNAVLTHDDRPLADLLAGMGEGLLVTEMMGQGVNLVTGDYSRGASGFWVSGGQIAYPVSEITVAGNVRDMLMNIDGVASDVDTRGAIQTGSILVGRMTVAGN
ncbi:MAG: metalloprotease PmbA [Pseudomonadota bacterium]